MAVAIKLRIIGYFFVDLRVLQKIITFKFINKKYNTWAVVRMKTV